MALPPLAVWVGMGGGEYVIFLFCTVGVSYKLAPPPPTPHPYSPFYRGRIPGRNPDKSLQSFPPCYSKSSLQLWLEISISSNSRNFLQFLQCVTVHCRERRKTWQKTHPLLYGETSSLRIFKSMPRNLKRNRTFMNSASEQFINQQRYEKCGSASVT